MSDYVPFHIQFEIIIRLPVKSLIQFRTVSKQWKSLIDSSEFTASYNVRQTQPQCLSVRYNDPLSTEDKFVSFVDDETFALQDFTSTAPKLLKELRSVLGNSRGVFCLYGYYQDPDHSRDNSATGTGMAVLWNPSIRKSVGIAVRDRSFEKLGGVSVHVSQWSSHHTVVGFGVCPTTNDPTIVKFTRDTFGDPRKNTHIPWVVEVFTLSAGCWRSPSTKPPNGTITLTWDQVVVDKFMYWFSFDGIPSSRTNFIMSYDMTTEEIIEVELPDYLAQQPCFNLSISCVWESLAVLEYTNTNTQVCVVWMMDHVFPNLFTTLFTINTPNWNLRNNTLGFTKSGKPILMGPDEERAVLVVYDPVSEHIKDIGIYGNFYSFFVGSYMETLILLDQVDCSVYSNIS